MSRLVVDDLTISYRVESKGRTSYRPALHRTSLVVESGQALGILGETGSGKSSLGLAIMRLLPASAKWTGRVALGDYELSTLPRKQLGKVRGREIGLIFQDPSSALNPVRTIGAEISATARAHNRSLSRRAAHDAAGDMLEQLGVDRRHLHSYPHQLSGGMQQRALIASVMIAGPKFLIADEPTAALDKVTERQIVALLRALQREQHLGFIVISHDIGIVSALCRDVAVIYKGRMVERGSVTDVLNNPRHPYTRGLVRASRRETDERGRLVSIPPGVEEVAPLVTQ